MTQATVKGYSLCLDVEEEELRLSNRANIMANIFEDNRTSGSSENTSGRGLYILTQYMEGVPKQERGSSLEKFYEVMKERGYSYAN